jgi:hypothetical protein
VSVRQGRSADWYDGKFEKFEFEIEWISTEGHGISELLYLASGWAKIFEAINMHLACHLLKMLPPRSKDGSRE